MSRRRFLACVLTMLAFSAGTANAADYYVSPAGSDTSAGTSSAPWKTVGRVNRATLSPGDNVLFQGGQSFADATLMPTTSGTAAAPITFGSYGTGRATITNPGGAVWFSGKSYLIFDRLTLTTGGADGVILSGSNGGTSSYITVRNSVLTNTGYSAINVPNHFDNHWVIADNTISQTGDSGLIIQGSDFTITGNTITGTGHNPALAYGKHGIYAKGPDMTIANNDFSQNQAGQSISLRMRGALVYGNSIHDTSVAISYFSDDTTVGVDRVYANRAWNITSYFFYYGANSVPTASSPVGFVIASNTVVLSGASEVMNLSEITNSQATTVVANNVFTGTAGSAYRGCGQCTEHHNDWNAGTTNLPSGTGDIRTAPLLSPSPLLVPALGSPVIGAGTSTVTGLSYVASCDGQSLHYCGSAPEMGVEEYLSAPSGSTAPTSPTGFEVTASTLNSVTLSWQSSTDDVGVAGYDLYANGVKMGTTAFSTATVAGLTCSTTYTLGVQAFDADGNRSSLVTVPAKTQTCVSPPIFADTTSPNVTITSPASGAAVGKTFTVSAGAVDGSGIAELRFLMNGVLVCVVSGPSGSCSMASKGGWNTVTVQARDNAGNVGIATLRVKQAKGVTYSATTQLRAAKLQTSRYRLRRP
jgi:parallel beta-helix repeat protein